LRDAFHDHSAAPKANRAPIKLIFYMAWETRDVEYAVAAKRMTLEADGTVVLEDCCLCWEPYRKVTNEVRCTAESLRMPQVGRITGSSGLRRVKVQQIELRSVTFGDLEKMLKHAK
jgi:hypothetical protein